MRHTVTRTMEIVSEFGWEQLLYPPCITDLATFDFHLSAPQLKEFLDGTCEEHYEQIDKRQSKDFYAEQILKACLSIEKNMFWKNGDYIEKKKNFFPRWNVSYFIVKFPLFIERPSYICKCYSNYLQNKYVSFIFFSQNWTKTSILQSVYNHYLVCICKCDVKDDLFVHA